MKKSIIEKKLMKKANLRKKEMKKHKENSLKNSLLISLFFLLVIQLILKDIFISGALTLIVFTSVFVLLLQKPLIDKKKYSKKIEAELPELLINIVTGIRAGKDLLTILKENKGENKIGKEIEIILKDIKNGFSFENALTNFNLRVEGREAKRFVSALNNIYRYGSNEVLLKKLSDEMLVKQRIESKEYSGKMVVFALVFIVVSSIVPAMFSSFVLVGSYFMELQFTGIQIFFILIIGFPLLDVLILNIINSKTPYFLRAK